MIKIDSEDHELLFESSGNALSIIVRDEFNCERKDILEFSLCLTEDEMLDLIKSIKFMVENKFKIYKGWFK